MIRLFRFFRDGFRASPLARCLGKLVLIKLLVLLAIGWLFFPDRLQTDFATDAERAAHVLDRLAHLPGGE